MFKAATGIGENMSIIRQGDGSFGVYCQRQCLQSGFPTPKKASDWAFENGATEVRHDYDLVAAEQIHHIKTTK